MLTLSPAPPRPTPTPPPETLAGYALTGRPPMVPVRLVWTCPDCKEEIRTVATNESFQAVARIHAARIDSHRSRPHGPPRASWRTRHASEPREGDEAPEGLSDVVVVLAIVFLLVLAFLVVGYATGEL